jgi:uncharacterized membrane protein
LKRARTILFSICVIVAPVAAILMTKIDPRAIMSAGLAILALAILYRGAGLMSVWQDFAAVAGMGLVFFLAALARFRRTVSLMQV